MGMAILTVDLGAGKSFGTRFTDTIRHGMAEHDPFNRARVSKTSGALLRRCLRTLQGLQDQAYLAKRLFAFVCAL